MLILHTSSRAEALLAAFYLAKAREQDEGSWQFWLERLDRTSPEYRKRAAAELSGPDRAALEITSETGGYSVRMKPW
jgi:hypothetical protein